MLLRRACSVTLAYSEPPWRHSRRTRRLNADILDQLGLIDTIAHQAFRFT